MKKNKEQKPIRCIAYLSVFGHDERVEEYEKKQLKKIREYAAAHNIEIIRIFHKDVLGQGIVNEHFAGMVSKIRNKQADGVLVFNMRSISPYIENAYTKVGMVKGAGGRVFTVQEGELGMVLRNFAG